MNPSFLLSVFLTIMSALFFGVATPMYKQSVEKIGVLTLDVIRKNLMENIKKIFLNKFFALATLFQLLGTFMFLVALPGMEVSVASPILALTYVFTAIYSHIFLKENLTIREILGITIIIIGVVFITLPVA